VPGSSAISCTYQGRAGVLEFWRRQIDPLRRIASDAGGIPGASGRRRRGRCRYHCRCGRAARFVVAECHLSDLRRRDRSRQLCRRRSGLLRTGRLVTEGGAPLPPAPASSPTVSQMCHAFAEPGGNRRTLADTKAGEIEYSRTLEEPAGYGRTRDTAGSGP